MPEENCKKKKTPLLPHEIATEMLPPQAVIISFYMAFIIMALKK